MNAAHDNKQSNPDFPRTPACIRSYLAIEAFSAAALSGLLAAGHDPTLRFTVQLALTAAESLHDELAARYREIRTLK